MVNNNIGQSQEIGNLVHVFGRKKCGIIGRKWEDIL